MFPVYIPSNKPIEQNKTFKALEGRPQVFVVNDENLGYPEDVFVQSPTFEDMHLPRKRQFIAELNPDTFFWTIDDDLTGVYKKVSETSSRKVESENLPTVLEEAEKEVEEDLGYMTVRKRGLFDLKYNETQNRSTQGSPCILWNGSAVKKHNIRFDLVDIEEDVVAMLYFMYHGFDVKTQFSGWLVDFDYAKENTTTDKQIEDFIDAAPPGSCWWKNARTMRVDKSRRHHVASGRFLQCAPSKEKFRNHSANMNLDEFF